MAANGDDPDDGPTPYRWRLTVTWAPSRPGVDGLHEIMWPIVRVLSWLDRSSDRRIAVYVGTLRAPPDDPEP